MPEMSPQEAALVWTQVPQVEQTLTARVAGLANVMTGLAIAAVGFPLLVRLANPGNPWAWHGAWPAAIALVLLFLALRRGVWSVYAAARPAGHRGILHTFTHSRATQAAYVAVIAWWVITSVVWGRVPDGGPYQATDSPFLRSGELVGNLLLAYTISAGAWESRQAWSARPYLLVIGGLAVGLAFVLRLALENGSSYAMAALGAGWMLAGLVLYAKA